MVKAHSAGVGCEACTEITINDEKVKMETNPQNNSNGLHIVVINSANGRIELAKIFDTSSSSAKFDQFIGNQIPHGYIIAAACHHDCVSNLSQSAKQWFQNTGSKKIVGLKMGQAFAFIG